MRTPRQYPMTLASAESGRPMQRGNKLITLTVDGHRFKYRQPGWWCSLDDPDDLDGQLVDDDNKVAELALRTAKAMAKGEAIFVPVLIRAIRLSCGLSQRQAGNMFGTGEKSFEKYESGEIVPSEPTKRLLRLAMLKPDMFRVPTAADFSLSPDRDPELVDKTLHAANLDELFAPLFVQ